VESEAAWRLVKTTIACGLELLSISRQQESLMSQTLSIRLHILQAAVQAWQAQLWLKVVIFVYPKAARFSHIAICTAEHHRQLPNQCSQPLTPPLTPPRRTHPHEAIYRFNMITAATTIWSMAELSSTPLIELSPTWSFGMLCQLTVPTAFSLLWQASLSFHALGGDYIERQAKDQSGYMRNMIKALATLDRLTPFVPGYSDPLIGEVLEALTEARIAVRQHWHAAAAAACDTMQSSSRRLTLAMTPSWRERLPANADWQILVDTCGKAIHTMGSYPTVMAFCQCRQAGSVIC